MMTPAADVMRDALANVEINMPSVTMVNNVTAQPVLSASQIREDLVAQVTGRVRWRETIEWMASPDGGIESFAEPGCGKVLTQMLKRIVKGVSGKALNTPESLENFAKELETS